jgi:hypothetical protein
MAAGGGCHGGSGFRRGGRGLGQHVTSGGALGSREARRVVGRWRARAEDGPHRQRCQWRGGGSGWRAEGEKDEV